MRDGAAWLSAWAKTGRDPHDPRRTASWLPLHQHLADTAGIARLLVDHWVSPLVLGRIGDALGDAADVRTVATWLAAVHDVGKISPAFAVQAFTAQAPGLVDRMRPVLDVDPLIALDTQRPLLRHELVGHAAVREWLTSELGFAKNGNAVQFAVVVGGHHGTPPDDTRIGWVRKRRDLSGRGPWATARVEVLEWAADLVGGREALARYATANLDRPAQVLLSGIVVMADWIASNPELFPLDPLQVSRLPDPERTAERVRRGWTVLDLPPRWSPRAVGDPTAAFTARFGRQPRPVQLAAAETAATQPVPGLVVIEAPMGEGKTEAALLAAEILAERSGADGCYVALPTRATTDAMFSRVLDWMAGLPGLDTDPSVTLAHGTASLNDRYRGLVARGWSRSVGEDGCEQAGIVHQWLRGSKKGQLAQFVVGTVDQVLFAGLKSRHLVLRHLGLAGKVVIIDEVHAYDVYMSRFLDRVLHWLGAYGTPVVLLSATLPGARRAELVAAYESGCGSGAAVDSSAYPLVTASGLPPLPAPASGTARTVALERLPDDLDGLVALLRRQLIDGGCAVVVRNTVGRVQQTADRLIAEFGDAEVTVTHSRYLACDRARLDAELLRRFGPPGAGVERPARHIVVASQVVEQSLDVDFDLMVTDLAPIDLVLQRMGRLHRHARPRPTSLERPRCVLVGTPDWAATPVRAAPGSRRVYGEHTLLRAAALLHDRDAITLPDDIAPLVEAGYGDTVPGPPSWNDAMGVAAQSASRRRDERQGAADVFRIGEVGGPTSTLVGWVSAGTADIDDRRSVAHVRDGAETLEVLVVQSDADGGLTTPSWLSGGALQIPLDLRIEGGLARTIASCALRLPIEMSLMNEVGDGVLAALEKNHYTSFDQSPLLSGQLVLVLDEDRRAEIRHGAAAFDLSYDPRRGLRHESPA